MRTKWMLSGAFFKQCQSSIALRARKLTFILSLVAKLLGIGD